MNILNDDPGHLIRRSSGGVCQRSMLTKAIMTVLTAIIIPLCMSCGGNKEADFKMKVAAGKYLHLHTKGGWGIDRDLWIFPDDSFRACYRNRSKGSVENDRFGSNPGSFKRIVSLTDSLGGWRLTSDSLKKDMESAKVGMINRKIFDVDHAYLEFKIPGKSLVADYYAAGYFAKFYPKAKEVSDFAKLQEAVSDAIDKP
ncbi:MAG: hypothetical protein ABIT37_06970 [Luteolibacter sp.]